MAEVLGLVASVVAVIQLTEAVDKTVSKYLHSVKSTQSVLVPLLGKIRHLSAILKTLQIELDATRSIALQHLEEPLRICGVILVKVQSRLDNLKIIAGCVVGLLLDKETFKYVKRLDDLIPVLQLALDADTLTSTHAIEDYLQSFRLESFAQGELLLHSVQAQHDDAREWKREADERERSTAETQLRESIFNWLTVVDPEKNYLAACLRNQPGTGNWLLESADFEDWESGNTRFLWLNAMAGAGKTILSSTIVRHLIAKYDDSCVTYYFFDFKETAKQDVRNLIASLLVQTAGGSKNMPEPLLKLFQRHTLRNPERPTSPTADELLETLIAVMTMRQAAFIVIDALDESQEVGLLLETMCILIQRLGSNCRLLLTSRPEHEIRLVLEKEDVKCLPIQSNNVDHDVALYVRAILQTDERLRVHRQGVKDLITTTLTNGAKGMFRWVQCQIDHIKTVRTANAVKAALRELPPTLDQTYDRILTGVQPEDQDMLHKALQLIAFAARPLCIEEIAEAVIIKPGIYEIDEDDRLQRPEDLLDIGKSLFTQNASSPTVNPLFELSHYSVKEYLLSDRITKGPAAAFAINETDAELMTTGCLLTYMGLDEFKIDWPEFEAEIEKTTDLRVEAKYLENQFHERTRNYPLLAYAAKYCLGHHCKSETTQREYSPLVVDLFMSPQNGLFQNMTFVCVYDKVDTVASLERLFRYSLIGIAARYNLSIIVQNLLLAGVPVDDIPSRPSSISRHLEGQTALSRAADFGHVGLCKMLVEAGANVQGTDRYDCPLSAASRSGKPEIVKLMLDANADVLKDAVGLADTQVQIWWWYIETKNSSQWRIILDILRYAGAKWSTIGLLSAFSKTTKLLINTMTEYLERDSGYEFLTQDDYVGDVVDGMDPNTLTALQWLAQDPHGTNGLKASLKTIVQRAYENQPHLFVPTPSFTTLKFTAEEMITENLICTYFRPVIVDGELTSATVFERSKILLDTLWDNVNQTGSANQKDSEITGAQSEESGRSLGADSKTLEHYQASKDFIIFGDILQAWSRSRWDDSYAHFFD